MTFANIGRKAALAALLATTMIPAVAYAGEQERAVAAIAEARGKIDAGDKVHVADQAPEMQAKAREALRMSEEYLVNHKKREALDAAHHASELADEAILTAHHRMDEAAIAHRANAQNAVMAAQQTADAAKMQADAAHDQTIMANQRANAAEQSAAAANAQADALRQATPPPTTTTVAVTRDTTVAPAAVHHTTHRVVKKRVTHVVTTPSSKSATTTVVTTSHQ